jgi:hypothetical protein
MRMAQLATPLVMCLILAGCRGGTPTNDAPPPPVAKPLSADQKVLLALDCYDPMYKLDADGRVIRLHLTGRNLSADVLADVGKLTELGGLDLYGANITDDGLANLKDLQKLRSCGLGGTPITDKSLPHLAKLNALQHLWVPARTISKAALEKLKEERPDMNVHPQ